MTPDNRLLYLVIASMAGLFLLFSTVFTLQETQQAMVVQLGRVVREVNTPGLHAKVPFFQQAVVFDKRILSSDSPPEEVQSLDKKRVVVDSFTRWKIEDAAQFYRTVRNENIAVQRLNTIVNSSIRAVVASVNLQDLISTKRSEVMTSIHRQSAIEAAQLGIRIVDVRLKRADLPHENSEAIYRRMRAERQKEAAEIRAKGGEESQRIRSDAEKQRTILLAEAKRDGETMRGQGDATAIRTGGAAFNADPDFYRFQRGMEAYRQTFAGSNTMFVLDPQSTFLKPMVGE